VYKCTAEWLRGRFIPPRATITRSFINSSVVYIMRDILYARTPHINNLTGVQRLQRTGTVPNIARLKNDGPACRRDAHKCNILLLLWNIWRYNVLHFFFIERKKEASTTVVISLVYTLHCIWVTLMTKF